MNTNLEFCKKLFEKMKEVEDFRTYIILDYFSLKTAKIIEKKDANEIGTYAGLFQNMASECGRNEKLKKFELYFNALSDCISNYGFFIMESEEEMIRAYLENLKEIVEEDWKWTKQEHQSA